MAADLSDAIVAALKADETVAADFGGGFWANFAPVSTPPPFVVVTELGESASFSSVDGAGAVPCVDTGQIQVSVFCEDSRTLAKELGQTIENFLNDRALTFTSGYLMNLRRTFHTTTIDPDPFRDGHYLWQRIITFTTTVGRTL